MASLFFFSCLGDFRMIIGEDRFKVQNIVKPNIAHFQKLYSSILQGCPQVVYKHQLGRLEASVPFKLLPDKASALPGGSAMHQDSSCRLCACCLLCFCCLVNSAPSRLALNIRVFIWRSYCSFSLSVSTE